MLQLTITVAKPLPIMWQQSRLIWCIDSNVELRSSLPSFLLSSLQQELGSAQCTVHSAPPPAIQVNNDWLESILRIWLEPIKGEEGKGVSWKWCSSCREFCKRSKLMSFLPVPASWSGACNLGAFWRGSARWGHPTYTLHPLQPFFFTARYGGVRKAQ